MRLVPADEVDAFPGFVYKLFRISHDHFLAVLDTATDKKHSRDDLLQCFVAKLPPIHEVKESDWHWMNRATELDAETFDRNNNIKLLDNGVPHIRWGDIENYIANAKFDI